MSQEVSDQNLIVWDFTRQSTLRDVGVFSFVAIKRDMRDRSSEH